MDFSSIDMNRKFDIQTMLNADNHGICEHCFTDLFMWQGHYQTQFSLDDDFLYIKSKDAESNQVYYMAPVGNGDIKSAILKLIDFAGEKDFILASVTEEKMNLINAVMPDYFEFFENRDSADYIYLSEKMISLSGKKLHSKRNFINRFIADYNWSFEQITSENIDEVWNFHQKWHKETGCVEEQNSLEAETCAIKKVVDNFDKLDVFGGILRVDGQVVAFSFGTKSRDDLVVIQIEKADVEYAGAYPMINKMMASEFCSDVMYINREEDLGLEGLRKAKLSYKPEILMMKYYAKIKEKK